MKMMNTAAKTIAAMLALLWSTSFASSEATQSGVINIDERLALAKRLTLQNQDKAAKSAGYRPKSELPPITEDKRTADQIEAAVQVPKLAKKQCPKPADFKYYVSVSYRGEKLCRFEVTRGKSVTFGRCVSGITSKRFPKLSGNHLEFRVTDHNAIMVQDISKVSKRALNSYIVTPDRKRKLFRIKKNKEHSLTQITLATNTIGIEINPGKFDFMIFDLEEVSTKSTQLSLVTPDTARTKDKKYFIDVRFPIAKECDNITMDRVYVHRSFELKPGQPVMFGCNSHKLLHKFASGEEYPMKEQHLKFDFEDNSDPSQGIRVTPLSTAFMLHDGEFEPIAIGETCSLTRMGQDNRILSLQWDLHDQDLVSAFGDDRDYDQTEYGNIQFRCRGDFSKGPNLCGTMTMQF